MDHFLRGLSRRFGWHLPYRQKFHHHLNLDLKGLFHWHLVRHFGCCLQFHPRLNHHLYPHLMDLYLHQDCILRHCLFPCYQKYHHRHYQIQDRRHQHHCCHLHRHYHHLNQHRLPIHLRRNHKVPPLHLEHKGHCHSGQKMGQFP